VPVLALLLDGAPEAARVWPVAEAFAQLAADVLRKDRRLTSVALGNVPDARGFVGGTPLEAQRRTSFFVDVRVTAQTNSGDDKVRYVGAVFERMQSARRPARGELRARGPRTRRRAGEWPCHAGAAPGRAPRVRCVGSHRPSSNASAISSYERRRLA
jgi:phenylpyruvate tautomerase PptA (4-oxalocrotonate tautomerase family)